MIRLQKEGDRLMPGLNIEWVRDTNLLGEPVRYTGMFVLVRVSWAWSKSAQQKVWWAGITFRGWKPALLFHFDLYLDHVMYRPLDADDPSDFVCRRCGRSTGDTKIPANCKGVILSHRGGDRWDNSVVAVGAQ